MRILLHLPGSTKAQLGDKVVIKGARREPAYGAQMATYFQLTKARSLVVRPAAKPPVALTRLGPDVDLPERADPVLHELTQVVVPPLNLPRALSELFLECFRLLFYAHVVQKYAPSFGTLSRPRGGLAPWQKRRVMELFREHLDGSLKLPTLAGECGLSVSHFARAFRQSFGTPPHQYLVLQRVERAKALLSGSTCALSEVAQQAGFSDQASFSRTFKAVVGTSPGQWRRQQAVSTRISV